MRIQAPIAAEKPHDLTIHGHTRSDPYYWLRERENPEVIQYLKDENAYLESSLSHLDGFKEKLFEELKARLKEDDSTVPYKKKDYFYYTRYESGKEYPIYCRKKESLEADEELILDVNVLAEGHDFFSTTGVSVSPGQTLLAFAEDSVGRRKFKLRIRDLNSNAFLKDEVLMVTGNFAWSADSSYIFYTRQDQQTLRGHQIVRHRLGTDAKEDVLVFEEKDETFTVSVGLSRSEKYLFIRSYSTLSRETRYLDAAQPTDAFTIFLKREDKHEYGVDHLGDTFYIRSNLDAKNFRILKCPEKDTRKENWSEVVAHKSDTLVESFELFSSFFVLKEMVNGLDNLRVMNWGGEEHCISFEENSYMVGLSTNAVVDTDELRFTYQSLATSVSVFSYDMKSKARILLKQKEVVGDFDSNDYVSERVFAQAGDGTRIPVSLLYRKGLKLDGSNPLLIYGYGSYGYTIPPYFSSDRLSLVDRGFVFAMAHVRGGQIMGRSWYEDGKLLKKKNTFTDFIDAAEYLIREKYTCKEKLMAMGASAGGLLMGAIMNMRPDLFAGIVAGVPFVDVVTTMLDDSIPLTTGEYDEWGNPNKKEFYNYMLSYSPYDNVTRTDYPALLITTGLHDSQVQYWEPAKWVAKIRQLNGSETMTLLKTDMSAGHGGKSGRFNALRDTALKFSFLLSLAGKL